MGKIESIQLAVSPAANTLLLSASFSTYLLPNRDFNGPYSSIASGLSEILASRSGQFSWGLLCNSISLARHLPRNHVLGKEAV
jgi:hypothetical protein